MGESITRGEVLAGKYRVERVLGSGGMGVVVAARHVQLGVLVALKFMSKEALADKELTARFLREARAAARLRSEHVARVADVGTLRSGAPYLVMEYLEGIDLSALLSKSGRQAIPNAVEFVVQACDALDEAHRAGIVHRDVRPSNLFLTTRPNGTPCIKVLDFGISKSEDFASLSTRLQATRPSAMLGSPFYMAPEQMRAARDVDLRADIWALGATLYELLTGRLPFEAESLADLILRVYSSEPAPPRNIRPEIPWLLEQLVLGCLEKDPGDRFASARALGAALAPFMPGRGAPSRAFSARVSFEETDDESGQDAVTRVEGASVRIEATGKQVAQGPDRMEPAALSPLNPRTTLPMAASSAPPVAQSASHALRTGARLSWGTSYGLLAKNRRTTLNLIAAGFVLSGGAIAIAMHASQSRPRASEGFPGDAMVSASPPSVASGVVAKPAEDFQTPLLTNAPIDSSSHIPAVLVTDLPKSPAPRPSVPRLGFLPQPPPAARLASSPSCEKPFYIDEYGRTKSKSECGDAASPSAPPAPPPNNDFEKNPYLH
jgi:serine/threonine-protein kinase